MRFVNFVTNKLVNKNYSCFKDSLFIYLDILY